MADPYDSLMTPRRSGSGSRRGIVFLILAFLLLGAALATAIIMPKRELHRLEQALTPTAPSSRDEP